MRDDDAPLDAPQDRRLLIIGIIDVGHVPKDREDLGHQVAVAELEPVAGVHHGRGDVAHLPRDAVRVEDEVHKSRGDGVARHPVELGALGGLHDDHAVLVLDRADPVRSVGARARQDHGHRPVLIGSRQRAEEYVDRMVDIPVVVLLEPQDVRYDFQIVFGRDHVDMVAPYTHAVLRFHHGHRRVLPEDVRQKALVVRRQVLDDDERHPRIFGKKSQELLQRLQSARGRADADHAVRQGFGVDVGGGVDYRRTVDAGGGAVDAGGCAFEAGGAADAGGCTVEAGGCAARLRVAAGLRVIIHIDGSLFPCFVCSTHIALRFLITSCLAESWLAESCLVEAYRCETAKDLC